MQRTRIVTRSPTRIVPARGFSLIELMLSVTLGLLILAGLSTVFVNTSQSSREIRRTAEQIENGRFAVEILTQDIRHAGYYGEFSKLPAVPASAPDPCTLPSAGVVSDTSNAALALPIQVYQPASFTASATVPTACATLIPSTNLAPGSDIVVVRRADTTMLPVTSTVTAPVTAGTVYIQTISTNAEIQIPGSNATIDSTMNAAGTATTATMIRRDFTVAASGTPALYPIIAAGIRKYRTNVYFVAPCSVGSGTGGICTGASSEDRVPTLKRLELGSGGTFSIVPLAEGIQAIRVELGIDTVPATKDDGTGLIGDGNPDAYKPVGFASFPTVVDMGNAVAARIYVLARNSEASSGYKDDKTYTLGTVTTAAANDSYKRHVYGAETRIANQGGRREIPH